MFTLEEIRFGGWLACVMYICVCIHTLCPEWAAPVALANSFIFATNARASSMSSSSSSSSPLPRQTRMVQCVGARTRVRASANNLYLMRTSAITGHDRECTRIARMRDGHDHNARPGLNTRNVRDCEYLS